MFVGAKGRFLLNGMNTVGRCDEHAFRDEDVDSSTSYQLSCAYSFYHANMTDAELNALRGINLGSVRYALT